MRLYLCEKPDQARYVAKALGNPRPQRGFIETDGGTVTSARGHLMRAKEPEEYSEDLKTWSWDTLPILPRPFQFVPNTTQGRGDMIRVVFDLIKKATEIVVSTDPDREGEMIGYELLVHCGYKGSILRLWLQDTSQPAVKQALASLKPGAETEPLYHAALARSKGDWLVGYNLTRAASLQFRTGYGQKPLSIGRVQTPTLALLVWHNRKILNFVAVTYYEIKATVQAGAHQLVMRHAPTEEHRILKPADADVVLKRVQGAQGPLRVNTEAKAQAPEALFDINALQAAANIRFGWSADKTLEIAQKLYDEFHVLSYPRTEYRALPEGHKEHAPELLAQLVRVSDLAHLAPLISKPVLRTSVYDDKKVQAHYAIVPTMEKVNMSALDAEQRALYLLVARSYIAVHLPDYTYQATTVEMDANGVLLRATGRVPLNPGWKAALEEASDEEEVPEAEPTLPPVVNRAAAKVSDAKVEKKVTKPPKPMTEASLLKRMQNIADYPEYIPNEEARKRLRSTSGLGTGATRANIIALLKTREYIRVEKRKLVPTQTGMDLIGVLERVVPACCDPAVTAAWEDVLEDIAAGKVSSDAFLDRIQQRIQGDVKKIQQATGEKVAAVQSRDPDKAGSKPSSSTRPASGKPVQGTDLKVSYDDREKAKALGARFDGTRKLWVAPPGVDTEPFRKAGFL